VGGMIFSTFLTLVLVPTVYTLLARFTKNGTKHKAEEEAMTKAPAASPTGRASE